MSKNQSLIIKSITRNALKVASVINYLGYFLVVELLGYVVILCLGFEELSNFSTAFVPTILYIDH